MDQEYFQDPTVSPDSFPEGIAHFTLFNRDTTVVSERLVFVRKPDAVFQLAVSGTPADSRQPVKWGYAFWIINIGRFREISL